MNPSDRLPGWIQSGPDCLTDPYGYLGPCPTSQCHVGKSCMGCNCHVAAGPVTWSVLTVFRYMHAAHGVTVEVARQQAWQLTFNPAEWTAACSPARAWSPAETDSQ